MESIDKPIEILLIDDCSKTEIQRFHAEYVKRVGLKVIQLKENIGRAAIRNLFLKYAHYEHLLFLDCDSLIIRNDFIETYLKGILNHPNAVICGGRIYPKEKMPRSQHLRLKYGIKREQQTAKQRKVKPYASFMTNNFVVPRNVFQDHQFDEKLMGYGHEDTLFGFELQKNKIQIVHLDNEILNGDIESNVVYIKNTENALLNLTVILKLIASSDEFIQDVNLLRVYFKYKFLHPVLSFLFFLFKRQIRFVLSKGWVSLWLFDFYKIGYFNQMYRGG